MSAMKPSCMSFISKPSPSATLRTPCHQPQHRMRRIGGFVTTCRSHNSSRRCAAHPCGRSRSSSIWPCLRVMQMQVDSYTVHFVASQHVGDESVCLCIARAEYVASPESCWWCTPQGIAKATPQPGSTLMRCKRRLHHGSEISSQKSFPQASHWQWTKGAGNVTLWWVSRENASVLCLVRVWSIHTVVLYSCLPNTISSTVTPPCANDAIARLPQMFTYGAAVRKLLHTQEFECLYMHQGAYDSRQVHINTDMFHVSILSRYMCSIFGVLQYIYKYT